MTDDFDPMEADRPPREEGWEQETEGICQRIRNRGDQRIGQYLLNVVSSQFQDRIYRTMENKPAFNYRDAEHNVLWNLEAPELLEAMKQFDSEV